MRRLVKTVKLICELSGPGTIRVETGSATGFVGPQGPSERGEAFAPEEIIPTRNRQIQMEWEQILLVLVVGVHIFFVVVAVV